MIHKLEWLIVFFNLHLPWIMFLCLMTWSLFCVTLRFPNASLYLMTYVSWSLKVLHLFIFQNCLINAMFYSSYQHTFPTSHQNMLKGLCFLTALGLTLGCSPEPPPPCGEVPQVPNQETRIVGGQETAPNAYPWQVWLSIYLQSIILFIYLSTYLPVSGIYLSIYLSIYLPYI